MLQDLKKNPLKSGSKLRGQGGGKERRADPRYPVAAMAEATDLRTNTRVSGRISDIGNGGCYFEVMSPFAMGAELKVRITRDDLTLTASAKVLYSTGGMGMGLIFTKVEPDQRPLLDRWVGELSGSGVSPLTELEHHAGPAAGVAASATELQHEPAGAAERTGMNEEPRVVLNELITLLMRNRVLTDTEGKNLLRKLMT
ncbi:MAG TPA: PilZ domain-containing protein [Candidatus Acidoferrum sp.]|jgi:hypothetical protein